MRDIFLIFSSLTSFLCSSLFSLHGLLRQISLHFISTFLHFRQLCCRLSSVSRYFIVFRHAIDAPFLSMRIYFSSASSLCHFLQLLQSFLTLPSSTLIASLLRFSSSFLFSSRFFISAFFSSHFDCRQPFHFIFSSFSRYILRYFLPQDFDISLIRHFDISAITPLPMPFSIFRFHFHFSSS